MPRRSAARRARRGRRPRGRRAAGMQHTLSVLHTLRSSECTTAAAKAVGVGVSAGDEPRSAGAVQADRHAGLAGDGAELGDGGARAAGDGQRQAAVGEQRPAGGVRRRVDERHRAGRQPGRGERRREGGVDDRLRRAQRVAPMRNTTVLPVRSTPVASANTLGRPSNTKPTTPSGRTPRRHRPAVVLDRGRRGVAPQVGVAPAAQAGDHVGAHPVGQHQAGRRAPGRRRPVRRRRRWPRRIGATRRVVGEAPRRSVEERRDLVVGARRERGERRRRAASTARVATACSACGTCSRSPVSCTTTSRSPRRNAVGQLGRHDGRPGRRRRRSAGPASRWSSGASSWPIGAASVGAPVTTITGVRRVA